ncbi:MAG TPA: TolC family protein [Candidatus Sulfopaludibacter sp.]|jgi:outer membrane protein TolC|nr:TolC family protein [Candidatus Sulfopaludibacter sp.]
MTPRAASRVLLAWLLVCSQAAAQRLPIQPTRPQYPIGIRSYAPQHVPPVRLVNSSRLHALLRAGKLYLSAEDTVALAIENNLNLEIERYNPLVAQSALERSKAGGAIRGVPSGVAQISAADSGIGVNGTLAAAGLSSGGGGNGGVGNGGGATIQQIGAVTPQLDPYVQNATSFSHLTQPQANTTQSQTAALVDSIRAYNTVLTQNLITGGSVQFRSFEYWDKENAPTNVLNPAVGPHMDVTVTHNLLRGFGAHLNDRFIRIAKLNVGGSIETFRSRLLNTVVAALNQYWDLVAAGDELSARKRALEIAQKFREDTTREIGAGAMPRVEGPRAEAEATSRLADLALAQQNYSLREFALKQMIVRVDDPAVDAAEIVPVDHIVVPPAEELPPLRTLLKTALEKRPDIAVSKIRNQTDDINLAGTTNPLLPSLRVSGTTYNRGVAGTPQPASGIQANPYFYGSYGTALGQIFRRNFPSEQGSVGFSATVGNNVAQADYAVDQLQFHQNDLTDQRDLNRIVVDISSQMNALQQARSRHTAARDTRVLQEQLLAAEQEKFTSGLSTFNNLIADQRLLVAAQISEVNAAATYIHARISLDQVVGETLEKNHILLPEALEGKISRSSGAPQ